MYALQSGFWSLITTSLPPYWKHNGSRAALCFDVVALLPEVDALLTVALSTVPACGASKAAGPVPYSASSGSGVIGMSIEVLTNVFSFLTLQNPL